MKSISEPPARERILITAHGLFYQHGIRATGIDRIIAESGVAKATFYRHFPSKSDLIRAFLEYRHQRWLTWFKDTLDRHGGDIYALVPTLADWFEDETFRGCAFINTVGELAGELPEVVAITRRHKEDMIAVIADLPPSVGSGHELSKTLAVAIDGAIVCAQYDTTPAYAVKAVQQIVTALLASSTGQPPD